MEFFKTITKSYCKNYKTYEDIEKIIENYLYQLYISEHKKKFKPILFWFKYIYSDTKKDTRIYVSDGGSFIHIETYITTYRQNRFWCNRVHFCYTCGNYCSWNYLPCDKRFKWICTCKKYTMIYKEVFNLLP